MMHFIYRLSSVKSVQFMGGNSGAVPLTSTLQINHVPFHHVPFRPTLVQSFRRSAAVPIHINSPPHFRHSNHILGHICRATTQSIFLVQSTTSLKLSGSPNMSTTSCPMMFAILKIKFIKHGTGG